MEPRRTSGPSTLASNELSQQNYMVLPQPYNIAISPTISLSDVTVLIVPPVDPAHPMSDRRSAPSATTWIVAAMCC